MNPQELHSDFASDQHTSIGLKIDYKRILYRAIRYWYLIVLSIVVALTAAYLRNRYATRVYPITASIIIKETETSQGKLLYNNPLVSFYRNYLNELYIIRSYPLIQNVLEELNFGVAFYREGNFLTTEAYDYIPVRASVLNGGESGARKLYFKIISDQTFQLISNGEAATEKNKGVEYYFNDTIVHEGLRLHFTVNRDRQLSNSKNIPFIFLYTPPEQLTGSYVGKINAEWAEEGSGVVNLSINGTNPSKEIDFLNGLIKQYQDHDLEQKNASASRTIDFISDQLNNISDSLSKVERQLELFKSRNTGTDLGGEALRLYGKVEDLERSKTELIIRNNYYEYLEKYIQKEGDLDQVILPSSVGVADGVLVTLVTDMIKLQQDLKFMQSKQKLETSITEGKKTRINQIKKNILEAIRNLKGVDKVQVDFLEKNIGIVEKQLNVLPVAERQLVSIRRNYTLLENLYIFLLQKRAEAGISKASTTTDIAVVNPPRSGGAIAPKKNQNYTIAGIVGISLPFIIFILLELFNTRVQSKEDVEMLTKIPFIGGIGHKKREDNQEVLQSPKSSISESFRALRSNLHYFIGNKENGVFLITSSISGEGKTFTAINLASVFALSGRKTLIVGADMRKPKLFDDFHRGNEVGLSTFLAGIAGFDGVVQKTSFENMDLISGGPVPPNPSELLLTKLMDEFIVEARKRYDYIIIDTPPLAIVTDAFVLAKYADHTIFLVRQNHTPKNLLRTAEEFYRSGKLKNISILLNDIYKTGPGYGYGYSYGYGYGYAYGYGYGTKDHGYYSDEPRKNNA